MTEPDPKPMHLDDVLPEAPPIPEPDRVRPSLTALAALHLVLALAVIMHAVVPFFGGGIVSALAIPFAIIEREATPEEVPGRDDAVAQQVERRERFLRFWWLHVVLLAFAVLGAIGLARSAYAIVLGEFPYVLTVIGLALVALVPMLNRWLGWGQSWSQLFAAIAAVELVALHVPWVRARLADDVELPEVPLPPAAPPAPQHPDVETPA